MHLLLDTSENSFYTFSRHLWFHRARSLKSILFWGKFVRSFVFIYIRLVCLHSQWNSLSFLLSFCHMQFVDVFFEEKKIFFLSMALVIFLTSDVFRMKWAKHRCYQNISFFSYDHSGYDGIRSNNTNNGNENP